MRASVARAARVSTQLNQKVFNRAYERGVNKNVRFPFVIDMASAKALRF
jgi:hypothetical protein